MEPTKKKHMGFATMTPERRKVIARRGGQRAHELGKAHIWTTEEAVAAGKKGGSKTRNLRDNYKKLFTKKEK